MAAGSGAKGHAFAHEPMVDLQPLRGNVLPLPLLHLDSADEGDGVRETGGRRRRASSVEGGAGEGGDGEDGTEQDDLLVALADVQEQSPPPGVAEARKKRRTSARGDTSGNSYVGGEGPRRLNHGEHHIIKFAKYTEPDEHGQM